jgi:hypothetical protein
MANLVSDVIKCYHCDFWRRASGEWGRCSIELGSDLKVEANAGARCRGSMSCKIEGIQTQEDFFCANFREVDGSCPDQVIITMC